MSFRQTQLHIFVQIIAMLSYGRFFNSVQWQAPSCRPRTTQVDNFKNKWQFRAEEISMHNVGNRPTLFLHLHCIGHSPSWRCELNRAIFTSFCSKSASKIHCIYVACTVSSMSSGYCASTMRSWLETKQHILFNTVPWCNEIEPYRPAYFTPLQSVFGKFLM